MSSDAILAAVHGMLVMTLTLAAPFLLAAVITSFVVGLLQAATRISDLTLSFVPRFVAVMAVAFFAAAWMAERMADYIERAVAAVQAPLG
jgi:flagellar biosynthetic protein FliQ